MKGGWSSPFAPRVVQSWAERSKRGGFAKVASEVRENILRKAVEGKQEMAQEGGARAKRAWVVSYQYDHEGQQVVGVYTTKEGAHRVAFALAEKAMGARYSYCDDVVVEGVDLDAEPSTDAMQVLGIRLTGPNRGRVDYESET